MGTGSYDSNHSNEVTPHPRFARIFTSSRCYKNAAQLNKARSTRHSLIYSRNLRSCHI